MKRKDGCANVAYSYNNIIHNVYVQQYHIVHCYYIAKYYFEHCHCWDRAYMYAACPCPAISAPKVYIAGLLNSAVISLIPGPRHFREKGLYRGANLDCRCACYRNVTKRENIYSY